jgi:GNAT superfamily N-acetyltransferase
MVTEQHVDVSPTSDQDWAVAVITIAFSNDPVARWFLRSPDRYLTYWPSLVRAFGGAAFAEGTADSVDACSGVALWLPPGVGPDEEAMGALASEAVPAEDQDEAFAFMEQQGEFHPSEPHWYLPLIGVDGDKQGHGYGSVLLRHATQRCDRDGLPAFLEATNPRNRGLYERHGFEAVGVIQAGNSPPMWPMRREPRI